MTFSSPAEKCPLQGRLLINRKYKFLWLKQASIDRLLLIIRSNHLVCHLNQSIILPKWAMRDKRFADRIVGITNWFIQKTRNKLEMMENGWNESSRHPDTG